MKTYLSHELTMERTRNNAPLLRYDPSQDLAQWQQTARAKLEELLGLPLEKCDDDFHITGTAENGQYREITFEFQSEAGYYVPCHLLIPQGAACPLPVAICLQGHSTGMHISLGIKKFESDTDNTIASRNFGVRGVQEGVCTIVLDQRYMGAAGQQDDGKPSCLKNYTALAAMLWGRTAIGERVWDIMRLIDVIQAHLTEYADPNKIICMGNSGGGTATFYAACMDPRIYMAIPSCAVCTYEHSIMAMHHCACNYIPNIRKFFEMGDLGCLMAPRRLIVVSGKEDNIFPLPGAKASFDVIRAAYEKAGKADLCHMVVGNGGHQFYPDETWPIAHKLLKTKD